MVVCRPRCVHSFDSRILRHNNQTALCVGDDRSTSESCLVSEFLPIGRPSGSHTQQSDRKHSSVHILKRILEEMERKIIDVFHVFLFGTFAKPIKLFICRLYNSSCDLESSLESLKWIYQILIFFINLCYCKIFYSQTSSWNIYIHIQSTA